MWKVIKDNNIVTMFRTTGKMLPCIEFNIAQNMLSGRNNNGKNPSRTYSYTGCTTETIRQMLGHISMPYPTFEEIRNFKALCK